MTDLHLIFTSYPEMMTVESPQIPGLVGGRPTADEILRDLDGILDFAGVDQSEYDNVFKHEQQPVVSPAGNEYLLRVMLEGDDLGIRERTAGRMLSAIENGLEDAEEHLDRHPAMATGERLFIAVTGTDTIGWCMDQLSEGSGAVIEWNRDSDACWGMPLFPEGSRLNDVYSLEELGLTRESTIEACLDRVVSREMNEMTHSYFRAEITA